MADDAEVYNLRSFRKWAEAAAGEGGTAEHLLRYAKAWEEELRAVETRYLRVVSAYAKSDATCIYCGLPAADMMKCASGFPGCGRFDDMAAYDPQTTE